MATKKSASAPAIPTKVTVSGVSQRTWNRFKAKCKKANISAAERVRQLISDDIKV